jgi:hypothetical protein
MNRSDTFLSVPFNTNDLFPSDKGFLLSDSQEARQAIAAAHIADEMIFFM